MDGPCRPGSGPAAADGGAPQVERLPDASQSAQRSVRLLGGIGVVEFLGDLRVPGLGLIHFAAEFLRHSELDQGIGRLPALGVSLYKRFQVLEPLLLDFHVVRLRILQTLGILGRHSQKVDVGNQVVLHARLHEIRLQICQSLDAVG